MRTLKGQKIDLHDQKLCIPPSWSPFDTVLPTIDAPPRLLTIDGSPRLLMIEGPPRLLTIDPPPPRPPPPLTFPAATPTTASSTGLSSVHWLFIAVIPLLVFLATVAWFGAGRSGRNWARRSVSITFNRVLGAARAQIVKVAGIGGLLVQGVKSGLRSLGRQLGHVVLAVGSIVKVISGKLANGVKSIAKFCARIALTAALAYMERVRTLAQRTVLTPAAICRTAVSIALGGLSGALIARMRVHPLGLLVLNGTVILRLARDAASARFLLPFARNTAASSTGLSVAQLGLLALVYVVFLAVVALFALDCAGRRAVKNTIKAGLQVIDGRLGDGVIVVGCVVEVIFTRIADGAKSIASFCTRTAHTAALAIKEHVDAPVQSNVLTYVAFCQLALVIALAASSLLVARPNIHAFGTHGTQNASASALGLDFALTPDTAPVGILAFDMGSGIAKDDLPSALALYAARPLVASNVTALASAPASTCAPIALASSRTAPSIGARPSALALLVIAAFMVGSLGAAVGTVAYRAARGRAFSFGGMVGSVVDAFKAVVHHGRVALLMTYVLGWLIAPRALDAFKKWRATLLKVYFLGVAVVYVLLEGPGSVLDSLQPLAYCAVIVLRVSAVPTVIICALLPASAALATWTILKSGLSRNDCDSFNKEWRALYADKDKDTGKMPPRPSLLALVSYCAAFAVRVFVKKFPEAFWTTLSRVLEFANAIAQPIAHRIRTDLAQHTPHALTYVSIVIPLALLCVRDVNSADNIWISAKGEKRDRSRTGAFKMLVIKPLRADLVMVPTKIGRVPRRVAAAAAAWR